MADILDENFLQEKPAFKVAEKGTRLGGNILDTIGFYLIVFLHGLVLETGLIQSEGSEWFGIYFFFLYIMYFTLFEYFFSKTPGKFLTKTRVVKEDGSKPDFLNLLGRNCARLIPFDALSFLGSRGWHDQLSKTYVVKD